MEFYNSKTGERIPDDLIKKAFAGEIKLDNVSIGNRNMGNTSPVQEPEIAKVEDTPKKVQEEPEFEFFKMVNDHADDVKAREVLSSYEAVTHRDTNPRTPQKPEVKRSEAGTTLYYKALNASISLSKGDESPKNLPKRDRNRKSKIGTGDRSEKIRTYNYPQNRVTDHRIGYTTNNLDRVMNGALEDVIEALITEDQKRKLMGEEA